MSSREFCFAGGAVGAWEVRWQEALRGDPLPDVQRLDLAPAGTVPDGATWLLRGITSNDRYVRRDEKSRLAGLQEGLDRPGATCASMIPIRKSPAWWALTQDERRDIVEERSQHIAIGMRYLPAVARRLHHCRDLSDDEPFDFITWFEFAPEHESAFDRLLSDLRSTPEWRYVDREVELRLRR